MDELSKLPNSSLKTAQLQKVLLEQPADSVSHTLARAELATILGEPAVARATLHEILAHSWSDLQANHTLFARLLTLAITTSDFDAAAAMINRRSDTGDWFAVGVEDHQHARDEAIRWEIRDQVSSKLWFDKKLPQSSHMDSAISRLVGVLPLLASYRKHERFFAGSLFLNVGDIGYLPGLAFCDSRPEYFLIPDAVFVFHRAYADMRPKGGQRRDRSLESKAAYCLLARWNLRKADGSCPWLAVAAQDQTV